MIAGCHLHAVAAMAQNRVIGKDGSMPWHVPADLKFFKQLTSGHPILMGRKTWESLGRPLPNRRNLVLSRTLETATGAEIIRDVAELDGLGLSGDVYLIGGAQLYRLLLPQTDSIYLTLLPISPEGDTFFPDFESKFPAMEVLQTSPEAEWRRYTRV
jgi:dihydrofolate reductase